MERAAHHGCGDVRQLRCDGELRRSKEALGALAEAERATPIRGENAMIVPVVRFRHLDCGNRREAHEARLGRGMLVRATRIRVNEFAVERADRMRNQQEVRNAGQLPGKEQRDHDRGTAANGSRRRSLSARLQACHS